ncbi:MAG: efflux RND transporter periplasmic adaptor subunit [Deltaproteobacteria bacterium]|nr:efflux RND transporter periplasmic adaptor subunit [Deltaproteobacteria bacterium]
MKKVKKSNPFKRPLPIVVIICAVAILGLWGLGFFKADEGSVNNTPVFVVKKGPLRISVTEAGVIQAMEKIIVKNEVEGKTTVISLVDEGARVKKGDLLIELDSSNLLDQKVDQEIRVQNAEASFISARENLAVVENQAESDMDKAQLAYDFAVQDLDKYLKGEYPNELKELESKITLAEEDLTRAREKWDWSKKLYQEKYISQTELQADELAEKKKALDRELAQNDLDLFINFTHKRRLAQLESDVSQAKMALERTTRKARADVVQAEANLKAKESEYERQQDKLKKIETQIQKAKIYSPADGLVIYATSAQRGGSRYGSRSEPLSEGATVQERQELIHLPTASGYNAEVSIPEASLDKIRIGLPALVTVDALPGQRFIGRVLSIAPLPNAQSAFLNPDLKIYDTVVRLDKNGSLDLLRAGMSCTVEIIVEQYEEAVYVPIQAVLRVGKVPTAYVVKDNKLDPRKVDIGMDNNSMIRIVSGLEPGEMISLSPPLVQASVEESTLEKVPEIPPASSGVAPSSDVSGPSPDSPVPRTDRAQDDPTPSRSSGTDRPGDRFRALDKDGDGRLSREEFPSSAEGFDRLDMDKDGFIAVGEMLRTFQGGRSGRGSGESGPRDGQ